jgi:hypothetical protein
MRRHSWSGVRRNVWQGLPHCPYGAHQRSHGSGNARGRRNRAQCAAYPSRHGRRSGCDQTAQRERQGVSIRGPRMGNDPFAATGNHIGVRIRLPQPRILFFLCCAFLFSALTLFAIFRAFPPQRGDRYLCRLALAVIRYAKLHGTKHRRWLAALLARRPPRSSPSRLPTRLRGWHEQ